MAHKSRHYGQIAALHAATIDQGFLSTLGQPFLAFLYESIDYCSGCFLFVETVDGKVTGFVAGCTSLREIYARMLRQPLRLIRCLLPSLVRPARLRKIHETVFRKLGEGSNRDLPSAELMFLAVEERARGTGVAESLYRTLQREFAANGIEEFKIMVGEGLTPAHRFYRRMGAVPVAESELHRGQQSVIYVQKTVCAEGLGDRAGC